MEVLNKKKLEIQELNYSINKKVILKNINFNVNSGEFLSILGPSGCGKTTLLRILIGLIEPSSGKILKDGIDITKFPSAKRGMGIVFQNYALFENMTVFENVAYALKFNKKLKSQSKQITLDIIKQVGLSEHMNKKPCNLSGGQQQRVALARTLALNPDIVLFDEPMSALDVATRLNLRKEIKNIQKKFNTTMIYITHDQEEAFTMSDRIMVMSELSIHQLDTPENILDHPADQYIQEFVIDNLQNKIASLIRYARR